MNIIVQQIVHVHGKNDGTHNLIFCCITLRDVSTCLIEFRLGLIESYFTVFSTWIFLVLLAVF